MPAYEDWSFVENVYNLIDEKCELKGASVELCDPEKTARAKQEFEFVKLEIGKKLWEVRFSLPYLGKNCSRNISLSYLSDCSPQA